VAVISLYSYERTARILYTLHRCWSRRRRHRWLAADKRRYVEWMLVLGRCSPIAMHGDSCSIAARQSAATRRATGFRSGLIDCRCRPPRPTMTSPTERAPAIALRFTASVARIVRQLLPDNSGSSRHDPEIFRFLANVGLPSCGPASCPFASPR